MYVGHVGAYDFLIWLNLGGRFGLKNFGLVTCKVIDQPSQLVHLLDDKTIEVTSLDFISEEVILASYCKKEDFVEENESSNISMHFLCSLFYVVCF